jgi:hypothetical protein
MSSKKRPTALSFFVVAVDENGNPQNVKPWVSN